MAEPAEHKHKLAVALQYAMGVDPAPRVSAKGKGYMAEQIVALAQRYGVEVHEDADLAQLLSVLEVDQVIPLEAYVAVAEILSYIYKANSSLKHKLARPQ